MTDFDNNIRPQDDLFGYVNNNWIKKNPIPANESIWGTFNVLRDKSASAIKEIIKDLSDNSNTDLSFDQKLLNSFFTTALNYPKFKDNHLKTLKNEIIKINNIKTIDDLSFYIGYAHSYAFYPFWSCIIDLDDKDSEIQVLRIQQAGINLPNRDYYLDKNAKMKSIRKKYEQYFTEVQKFIPNHSPSDWNTISNIELELAKSSWTDIQLRNVEKCYNKFSIKELTKRFPIINWNEYFKGQGWIKPNDNIIIDQPSFIDDVENIFEKFSMNEIKQYLIWNIVNDLFSWIDETSANIRFSFYGKVITGKEEINPIWKRSIYLADDLMIGEVLGREYVKRYFPESSKIAVQNIVEDVRLAYHKHIDNVLWMKNRTKIKAHRKLDNIRVFIGYPSKWHDFSKLKMCDDNHILNILLANKFESDLAMSKIGNKPEREDWHMNAHTVNAYFDPNQLVICFPAAILQPPFFDPKADYATNLGGIGAVIGHELTHGFDDQGSEFDEFGNVKKWQTIEEKKAFNKISKVIINQANEFEVLPGLHLKGKLVIGEAIADIGGLELAIEALKAKTNDQDLNKELKKLFINSATSECASQRKEYLIQLAKTDPHPVAKFRINCVVTHINDFYSAFNVTETDKMYLAPEKRAHIW